MLNIENNDPILAFPHWSSKILANLPNPITHFESYSTQDITKKKEKFR